MFRSDQGHAAGVLGGAQEPPDLRQEGAPEHGHRCFVCFWLCMCMSACLSLLKKVKLNIK